MDSLPKVYARIVSPLGHQRSPRLIVDDCPYCGQTHRHSFSEQVGASLGTRAADCGRGEYELIDEATKQAQEANDG